MAQPSSRIPAWKRLGLKLQRDDQSGHEIHANVSHVAEHQQDGAIEELGDSLGNVHPSVGHVQDAKPGLGKRKHQEDPAEKGVENQKKSKKSRTERPQNGPTDNVVAASTEEGNAATASPKGDPNYRKRKGMSNRQNGEPKSHNTRMLPDSKVPSAGDTPLSPEQLAIASDGATLLVSTETDYPESPKSSPPQTDRRKSVTFAPDTKTTDGNSASNLFKKWAQEQNGPDAEFSQAEVAQFTPPPKIHPANHNPASAAPATNKTKKKDPSRYLNYLSQYHNDRFNWKFNKAIQNDVLENSLNIFRIPDGHAEALLEYVSGLQGAGVIERLRQRCESTIEEIDAADEKEKSGMDEAATRKAAQEEALQERLAQERKRRRLEGDIEDMLDHPYTEGYIRRMKKGRAKALLTALNLAAPAPTPALPHINGTKKSNPPEITRDSRKRKRRADVSSDESSDSSSSEESSSEDEDDSDDDSDAASSSADGSSSSTPDSPSTGSESEGESSESSEDTSSADRDSD